MERLATLFTGSFRQLRQVKTVTVCAMLGAIAIVLGSLSIELGSTLRIGFSGIPNEIVHMLFGPVVEMRPCSFMAWALAADGSKRTAMELVIADGNRINGSAILVSTPYTDNASLLVRP